MKVTFWGTRGSLPSTFTNEHLHVHLRDCLEYALNPQTSIQQGQSIDAYLKQMPSRITQTYGVNTSCVEIESGVENEYILCDAGTGIGLR